MNASLDLMSWHFDASRSEAPHQDVHRFFLQHDWTSTTATSQLFVSAISAHGSNEDVEDEWSNHSDAARAPPYRSIASIILSLLLRHAEGNGGVSASNASYASLVSSRSVLAEAVIESFRVIERSIHFASSRFCERSPLTCPLCFAASMNNVDFVKALLSVSHTPVKHAFVASRNALWNGADRCSSFLYRYYISHQERNEGFAPYFVGQVNVLTACWPTDGVSNAQDVVPDEGILLHALQLLVDASCDDDEDKVAAHSLLLSVPLPFLRSGGTIIHLCVRHGFHRTLRWLLETVREHTPILSQLAGGRRLSAIRFDALNQVDRDGMTPLSIAIRSSDVASCRLLLLYGASNGATFPEKTTSVQCISAKQLVERSSTTGSDMLRLFFPMQHEGGCGRGGLGEKNDGTPTSTIAWVLPSFETIRDSLHASMLECLSRSSVSALLGQVAQKLAQRFTSQKLQLSHQQDPTVVRSAFAQLTDPLLRTLIAALHADPWSGDCVRLAADVLLEVVDLVERLPSMPSHYPVVLRSMLQLLQQRDRQLGSAPAAHANRQLTYICAPDAASDHLSGSRKPSCHSHHNEPNILCDDSQKEHQSVVTHVRVVISVPSLQPNQQTSRSHFSLWIRLSPLMGTLTLQDALDLRIQGGHGFVEGSSSPGCPLQGGDLVFFTLYDKGFVATKFCSGGALKVSRADGTSAVLRRVSSGCWIRPSVEDIHDADPTVWMQPTRGSSILDEFAQNQPMWRAFTRSIVHVDRSCDFWAVDTVQDEDEDWTRNGSSVGYSSKDTVLCTPIFRESNDDGAQRKKYLPWTLCSSGMRALVCKKTSSLVGFIQSWSPSGEEAK